MTKNILLLFIGALVLASCDTSLPGGFWGDFQTDLIGDNESDQGPYGGTRAVFWASGPTGVFNRSDVLKFALANGWEPVDSLKISRQQMRNWYQDQTPVFPVYFDGTIMPYSDRRLDAYNSFERRINDDLTVYRCRTGWLLFYPGTDESTQENGYILISCDGTQMAVYHMWGE